MAKRKIRMELKTFIVRFDTVVLIEVVCENDRSKGLMLLDSWWILNYN
jgi:hypothetical protein